MSLTVGQIRKELFEQIITIKEYGHLKRTFQHKHLTPVISADSQISVWVKNYHPIYNRAPCCTRIQAYKVMGRHAAGQTAQRPSRQELLSAPSGQSKVHNATKQWKSPNSSSYHQANYLDHFRQTPHEDQQQHLRIYIKTSLWFWKFLLNPYSYSTDSAKL